MASKFFFSLNSVKPEPNNDAGNVTCVTSKEAPGFVNISFKNLVLNKKGGVEPIWHPNASKIGYCLEGNVHVSIRTPQGEENFSVKPGEMFFIPQGYVHSIKNIFTGNSRIVFALNHVKPEIMFLSKAVNSISDEVFSSTFNTDPSFSAGLKKNTSTPLLKLFPETKTPSQSTSNQYKFNIENSPKTILTKGGYLQIGTKSNLPTLDGLGILGFGLNPKGIVEPHWHTNAGELVFIVKGQTRITILSPDGSTESLQVNAGEGAFAPASHFHNIENIGNDEVKVIAFFSHAQPDYIGIAEVLGSLPNEDLSSLFNLDPNYFTPLKKTQNPLVIV